MREMEQLTIQELHTTATVADIALYGGLVAIGFAIAVWVLRR